MLTQSLVILILVGIIAGYLAGKVVKGSGYGLIGDAILGVVGAYVGRWVLDKANFHLGFGNGLVDLLVTATVGAVLLVLVVRLFFGSR